MDLKERIKKLSEAQKELLIAQIDEKLRAETENGLIPKRQIVAYLVTDKELDTRELKTSLKSQLPEYMIPSKFVKLDEFPRLQNGKIDVNGLTDLTHVQRSPDVSENVPKSDIEKQMIEIWEGILNFKPVKVDDNFFEIGGDSILSIQIVAKARKRGIILAPNQLFEHQTIAELALHAKNERVTNEEESRSGIVPLLPIQEWFFEEHKNTPHHWNQAVLFESGRRLDPEIFRKSVMVLVDHHDALRLNFEKKEGQWISAIREDKSIDPFHFFDLADVPDDELENMVMSKSADLQASLSLSESTLFQSAFFSCGSDRGTKILLFAHHLVVDSFSLGILIDDLDSIYQQLSENGVFSLPEKSSSYKKWGNYLIKRSKSKELKDEVKYWRSQTVRSESFPTDFEKRLPYLAERVSVLESIFNSNMTERLLNSSRRAYNAKTDMILIAALMFALNKWAGIKQLSIGIENHGREPINSGLDLSSSVGWFTTYFPAKISIENNEDLNSGIVSIKEVLGGLPLNGLGYGVLRYLCRQEGFDEKPAVIFNYLGNRKSLDSNVFGNGAMLNEGAHSPKSERFNLLGLNASITDGELRVVFDFCKDHYKPETIQNLQNEFENQIQRIIEHCENQEASRYTPSDFSEAELNQDDLDRLIGQIS